MKKFFPLMLAWAVAIVWTMRAEGEELATRVSPTPFASNRSPIEQIEPSAARRWGPDGPGGEPSFVKHVVPMFNKVGCSARSCHGSFQGQGGFHLSLFGYDPTLDDRQLKAKDARVPRIDTKRPDQSLALQKPLGEVEHEGGELLEKNSWQHRVFRDWIAAGAVYNAKNPTTLRRLVVLPTRATLAAGESVALRVVAEFSDDRVEDVTPLTAFASNDEAVAEVEESGVVSVKDTGDTSIVVSYGGGVVTCQIVVPRPKLTEFPEFSPNNRIDELTAAKWRMIGVHPSELAGDEAFVRRVYVDVIGTLPTADEVRAFLNDQRVDKRARLIDELLNRPEFAAWWASIFSDWTGNNQSNLNNFWKVSSLWHDWFREKLQRNVPYDELVGGIITATSLEGRPLDVYLAENSRVTKNLEPRDGFDDGAYARRKTLDLYWMKRGGGPEERAIRTANAFLGVQIQCAQCHKHPFDRWTQSDFEGFTSFFRVTEVCDLDGTKRSGGRFDYDKVAVYPQVEPRYKALVKRYPPKILAGEVAPYEDGGKDPREALWQWMRSTNNPYFAKNIVNRLWEHYFGVGIVDPVDDLNAANPPSNPPLFDWLAKDFIEHDFDLKHLHRRILNSRTYQLSHLPNDTNRTDRRNFSHALVRRMPAEVALDAVAQVTGTSLRFNNYAVRANSRAIEVSASVRYGPTEYFMDVFGRPKREQTCACERSNEASLNQALMLINDADIQSRIVDRQGRLAKLLGDQADDRALIEELYLASLSRYPTAAEVKTALDYSAESESRAEAMQDVLWSLINIREFLFVR